MANEENLRPFQPGNTASVGKGRPKGSKSYKTIFADILDGKITIEEAGKKKKITKRELLALNLATKALQRTRVKKRHYDDQGKLTSEEYEELDPAIQLKAIGMIMDREEGKPAQPLVGANNTPLNPEQKNFIVEFVDVPRADG